MTVLDVVAARHADLLDAAELGWVAALHALPEPSRRLYVRLATRRAACFRLSKLRYDEIGDIASAAAGLIEGGLASEEAPASLARLLAAFTVGEIDRLLDVPTGAGPRRAGKVRALLERDASADRAALACADAWVAPRGLGHFGLFRLCFFGNLRQDLSEFVLSDLGAVRYESYPLDASSRHFRTREQAERHLRHHECELAYERADRKDADVLRALLACLPARFEGDAHLERRLDRLRNAIARDLERLALPEEALHVYERTLRPPSGERRVRLLLRAGREEDARRACERLLAAPRSEAEGEFAERTLARLPPPVPDRAPDRAPGRVSGRAPERAAGRARRGVRAWRPLTTVLTLRDDGARVERSALAYYARSGPCYWLENGLVRSVLGLFVWDIVFANVPGAFFNPFQAAPADFREGFREARREALESRLAELGGDGGAARLRGRVLATLDARRGIANPLVRWGRVSRDALELALERIPPDHWRALFDRMLDDLSEHVSGLPDLVRFPDAGGYEFVEIKGPGDALQQHQRRWLRHFDLHGIPARVVHVRRVAAALAARGSPVFAVRGDPLPGAGCARAVPIALPVSLPVAPGTCGDLFAGPPTAPGEAPADVAV